jgi:ribosomal protein L37AE/L43A
MRTNSNEFNADFTCKQCGYNVSANRAASGVINRNHCPYCLYSRHVDLHHAGDRLCACKGLMAPVGMTIKNSRDKYASTQMGELMLVHRCTSCNRLSINRVAADDDPIKLLAVFKNNSPEMHQIQQICQEQGILLLKRSDRSLVHTRLFGNPSGEPAQPVSVH